MDTVPAAAVVELIAAIRYALNPPDPVADYDRRKALVHSRANYMVGVLRAASEGHLDFQLSSEIEILRGIDKDFPVGYEIEQPGQAEAVAGEDKVSSISEIPVIADAMAAQALAEAEASPANPYGSTKHGRFDAGSAAEVAEGVETFPPCIRCNGIVKRDADGQLVHATVHRHPVVLAEGVEPAGHSCDDSCAAGLCSATTPTRHGHSKVACTLANGHDGDHAASGTGTPGVSWPEGGTADWDAADKPQAKDGAR